MDKYVCAVCGYVYNPAEGDPDNGVPAGTSFDDVPDDWTCPGLRREQGSVRKGLKSNQGAKIMIYGFNAGEVFKIAIDIEENGRLFYEKAAAKTDNAQIRGVFEELGREEVKHKERFSALAAELPDATTGDTVWDPQGEIDQYLKMMADMHVFRTAADVEAQMAGINDAAGALKLAIEFEKDSIVFFVEMPHPGRKRPGSGKNPSARPGRTGAP